MKKLAIIASLAIAAPVFACPGHDSEQAAPVTAEKDKKEAPKQDKAKETPKAKEAPKTDTAKTKPAESKKPDKVSSK